MEGAREWASSTVSTLPPFPALRRSKVSLLCVFLSRSVVVCCYPSLESFAVSCPLRLSHRTTPHHPYALSLPISHFFLLTFLSFPRSSVFLTDQHLPPTHFIQTLWSMFYPSAALHRFPFLWLLLSFYPAQHLVPLTLLGVFLTILSLPSSFCWSYFSPNAIPLWGWRRSSSSFRSQSICSMLIVCLSQRLVLLQISFAFSISSLSCSRL